MKMTEEELEAVQNAPERAISRLPHDPTPRQLCALALERGATVEVLERLTALAERWDATEAKRKWVEAVNAFKRAVPPIFKTHAVNQKGGALLYKFASYDDIKATTVPLEREFGIDTSFSFEVTAGNNLMGRMFITVGSHTEERTLGVPIPKGMNTSSTQDFGAATSYLKRYLFVAAFDLVIAGEDSDAVNLIDRIDEGQVKELVDLVGQIQEKKIAFRLDAFVGQFGVAKLSDLGPGDFNSARNMLYVRLGLKPVEKP